jgi:hypothetical protein
MNIYIHRDVLGFQQHLLLSEDRKIRRVQEIPDTEILIYGDPELEEIAKVHGKTLPTFPSEPHRKALEAVLEDEKNQDVPWAMAMPPKAFKRSVEALADQLRDRFEWGSPQKSFPWVQPDQRQALRPLQELLQSQGSFSLYFSAVVELV